MTGGWIKLHNEELHTLYSSTNIITVIKLKRMRWAGHVAGLVQMRNLYKMLAGKREERDHSQVLGVDGKILVLQWTLRK
jgi:hypothetical protein